MALLHRPIPHLPAFFDRVMKSGTRNAMTTGLADAIAHGIGVAISPLVIIVLVIVLLSSHARRNGIAFLAGWLFGLIALGGIVFKHGGFGAVGGGPRSHGIFDLMFGVLLLVLALRERLHRLKRHGGGKLFAVAEKFTAVNAALSGFFFAAIYPKNLILTAAIASELTTSGGNGKIEAYLLFMAIASVPIAGPVLTCLLAGERIRPFLARMKEWLLAHNQLILILVLTFFGLKLATQGGVLLTSG